jgi:hypothetical protein
MTIISKVSELLNGHQTTVDLSSNTLSVGALEIGGTALSQTGAFALSTGVIPGTSTSVSVVANWSGIAGNSIALVFTGSNSISAAISTWNTAHPTNEATLTSGNGSQVPSAQTLTLSGGINAGSASIGDTATYVNFTPTSATIAGALAGIDRALANAGSGTQKVQTFTLNGTDITNKFITLSSSPLTPSETILLVEDAGNMFYGGDFTVSGNQLSWNGLSLDGILSSNDNLTVSYNT